jgi:tetratricopeptide (TPR) repeat protein
VHDIEAPARIITEQPSPPAAVSAKDEKATLNRLTAELEALGAKTDHEILGVAPSVGEAGVRAAFVAQSKLYHPDLFAQYSTPEIRLIATQIFVRIKRAFTQLMTRVQQRDPGAAASNLARALGGNASSTNAQRAAVNSLVVPASDTASVVALVADARRHIAHKRYEEAQRTLEKALAVDPKHRDVTLWLHTVRARRLKLSDDSDAALAQYRLVLQLDPKNLEATKELRAAERPSLVTDANTKKG